MGHARYIGRVGALAVALGIGTAVITTPGIAWADETGTSNDGGPSQSASETSNAGDDGGQTNETGGTGMDDQSNTGLTGSTTTTTTQGSTTTTVGGGPTPQVTFGNSTNTGSIGTNTPDADPTPASPSAGATAQAAAPTPSPSVLDVTTVMSTPTPAPVAVTPTATPSAQPIPFSNIGATIANTPGTLPLASNLLAQAANLRGATIAGTPSNQLGARSAAPNGQNVATGNSLQANTFGALVAPAVPVPTVPPPSFAETVLAIPGTIISTALNLITQALAPLIGPGAPADNPVLWAVLAFVRRQFNQGFANSTPVLAPRQTSQDVDDGQVHGTFGGMDADGDTLSYTASTSGVGAPVHGTVAIDQATGTYTYTPDVGYVGEDYFYVTATDDTGAPHIHGLGQTHATIAAVAVTVAATGPTNTPPVVGAPASVVDFVDQSSGVVTGHVAVTDVDPGDTLTYTLKAPVNAAVGTVDVNAATGVWTFTPQASARRDAYFSAGSDPVSFTVVASDGKASVDVDASAFVDADDTPRVLGTPISQAGSPDYYGATVSTDGRIGAQATRVDNGDDTSSSTVIRLFDPRTGAAIGEPVTLDGDGYIQFAGENNERILYAGRDYRADTSTFAVIDTATGAVLGEPVTLGNGHGQLQLSEDGSRAYAVAYDYDHYNETTYFAVIDVETGQLRGEPVVVENVDYFGYQYSSDGSRALLTTRDYQSDTVEFRIINTETGAQVGEPIVDNYYYGNNTYPTRDLSRLYVTDYRTLTIIDTATGAAVGQPITVDGAYTDSTVWFSNDGSRAYFTVSDYEVSHIAVIDTATDSVIAPVLTVDGRYVTFSDTEDGSRTFISSVDNSYDGTSGHVTVIDKSGAVIGSVIDVDGRPNVRFSDDGTRALVTSEDTATDTSTLLLVDPNTAAVVGLPITATGNSGYVAEESKDGSLAYFIVNDYDYSNGTDRYNTSTLTVVRLANGAVLGQPVVIDGYGDYPQQNPDGSRLLFAANDYDAHTYTLAIVDAQTGALLGTPITLTGGVEQIYQQDQSVVVLVGSDGANTSIAVVDTATGATRGGAVLTMDGAYQRYSTGVIGSRIIVTTSETQLDGSKTTRIGIVDEVAGTFVAAPIVLDGELSVGTQLFPVGNQLYVVTATRPEAGMLPRTTIAVIDLDDGAVVQQSSVDGYPFQGGIVPIDGQRPVILLLTADSANPTDLSKISTLVVVPGVANSVVIPGYLVDYSYDGGGVLHVNTVEFGVIAGTVDPATAIVRDAAIDLDTGQLVGEPVQTIGYQGSSAQVSTFKNADNTLAFRTASVRAQNGTVSTRVTVTDTATGQQVRVIELSGSPTTRTAVSDDRSRALVATEVTAADGTKSTSVSVIDTDAGTLVAAPVSLPGVVIRNDYAFPRVSFNDDGSRADVITRIVGADGGVSTGYSVFDTTTGALVGETLLLDGDYVARTYSEDGTRVYITTQRLGETEGSSVTTTTVLTTGTEAPALVTV